MDVNSSDNSRMYLVDMGASHGVIPSMHARRLFAECIRNPLKKSSINTANSQVEVSEGVRIRMADWDYIVDGTMMGLRNESLVSRATLFTPSGSIPV